MGFCEEVYSEGNCSTSLMGSWPVPKGAGRAWCTRQCLACGNCGTVSFSVAYQDCSWFAVCNVDALVNRSALSHKFETWAVGKANDLGAVTTVRAGVFATARAGHCGTTEVNRQYLAGYGCSWDSPSNLSSGNFYFSKSHTRRDWTTVVQKCSTACAACPRCAFFSLSLRLMECSWYSNCPSTQGALTSHFVTFAMPNHLGPLALGLAEDARPVTRTYALPPTGLLEAAVVGGTPTRGAVRARSRRRDAPPVETAPGATHLHDGGAVATSHLRSRREAATPRLRPPHRTTNETDGGGPGGGLGGGLPHANGAAESRGAGGAGRHGIRVENHVGFVFVRTHKTGSSVS